MQRSSSINSVMNEYNDLLKSSNNLQKENFYMKQEIAKLQEQEKINYLKYLEFSQILLTILFVSIILNFFFCIKEQ
tara:strand:+ start:27 stop:254 length:228 start_codon:yes stop_codon:yes gene_type:complete